VAVVKQSGNNTNIFLYLNGQSCGDVAVGTNYTSSATWNQVLKGKLTRVAGFRFNGTIAGLRISNTALYTAAFTPPDAFTQTASTTFLLWNAFKERVGNATFT